LLMHLPAVVADITGSNNMGDFRQKDDGSTEEENEQEKKQEEGPEAGAANLPPKRPRYNDKAFNDITIGDVESMTREVMNLRKKCAKQHEELTSLQNVKSEKTAMSKQNRELQAQMESVKKEADRLKDAYKEHAVDKPEKQAEEVKKVIEKNIRFQMTYEAAFQERLQGDGMEVLTSVPNVSQEALKILGIDNNGEKQTKYSNIFFGGWITKAVQNRPKICLKRDLSVKYYATTGELRIEGRYAFENAQKPAKKAKRKSGAEAPEAEVEGEVVNSEADSSAQSGLPISMT